MISKEKHVYFNNEYAYCLYVRRVVLIKYYVFFIYLFNLPILCYIVILIYYIIYIDVIKLYDRTHHSISTSTSSRFNDIRVETSCEDTAPTTHYNNIDKLLWPIMNLSFFAVSRQYFRVPVPADSCRYYYNII